MKAVRLLSLGLGVLFAAALLAQAEDKKDDKKVTLTGMLVCGKCKLKDTEACSNAIVVKDKDDKEMIYFLDDAGRKEKYHVCVGEKKFTVTGTVSKKDSKNYIKPDKDGVKPFKKAD